MFCSNCGKQLDDHVKFCTNCGTPVEVPAAKPAEPAAPVAEPAVKPAYVPRKDPAPAPKKGGKSMKIILPVIIAAIVVVAGLILALVTGLFDSDETKVFKAFTKSALSYTEAAYKVEVPEILNKDKDMVTSQSLSLWVDTMPEMPEIEGMGIQLDTDVDVPNRETQLVMTARYGAADIISAEMLLKDAELYVDVPQLTGGRSFMINTEALGQTLASYGVEEEGIDAFGFNVYDLIQLVKEQLPMDETFQLPPEAIAAFVDAIEAEKVGKQDKDINDHTLKCTVYDMVIPEDAMADLLEACIDAMPEYDSADALDLMVDLCREMGLPDYVIEEAEAASDEAYASMNDVTDDAYEAIDIVLEVIGDIELEVSVHKGYVVSVYYEESIEGVDIELTVDLGGGDNYVDDLSIEAIIDDVEMVLVSNGNHTGKGGVYTDTTTIEISVPGSDEVKVTSELMFEPKASDENFSWVLDADAAKVELNGQITTGKEEANVRLDDISVWAAGEKMVSLGMEMSVREYEGTTMDTGNTIDLTTISMDELYEEVMAMEGTAMAWAEDLMNNYPELAEMLGEMM